MSKRQAAIIAKTNIAKCVLGDKKFISKINDVIATQQIFNTTLHEMEDEFPELSPQEREKEDQETTEEWQPKFAIIALFVRWAKKNSTHYNSDSMSLVETIANQAEITPIEVLDQLKSYRFVRSQQKPFGCKFKFARKYDKNSKQLVHVSPNVQRAIYRLKSTACILQEQIGSGRCTTMASKGRNVPSELTPLQRLEDFLPQGGQTAAVVDKASAPTTEETTRGKAATQTEEKCPEEIEDASKEEDDDELELDDYEEGDEQSAETTQDSQLKQSTGPQTKNKTVQQAVQAEPLMRTHLLQSFNNRLWQEIEHRFLALHVTKFVFEPAISKIAPAEAVQLELKDYYALSLQLLSHCSTRRLFLKNLVHACMAYSTRAKVERDADLLYNIWTNRDCRENPICHVFKNHVSSRCVHNNDTLVSRMNKVFHFWREKARSSNVTGTRRDSSSLIAEEDWMNCICANVFRHYVSFKSNQELKDKLEQLYDNEVCNSNKKRKSKRKPPPVSKKRQDQSQKRKKRSHQSSTNPKRKRKHKLHRQLGKIQDLLPNASNLQSLKAKRRRDSISSDPTRDRQARSKPAVDPTQAVPKSSLQMLKENPELVERLQLAKSEDLDGLGGEFEFVIEHPDKTHRLHLAEFEIYCANLLKNLNHYRNVKDEDHTSPRCPKADAQVTIGREKDQYIDCKSNILHAVREGSDILDDALDSANPSFDIVEMIRALLQFGKPDDSRSPDSLRLHFASATPLNREPGTGRPLPTGMEDFLKDYPDEKREAIQEMIGTWACLVWDACQGMLSQANQPKMCTSPERREFNRDLRDFLGISDDREMGFESVTLSIMEIHPFRSSNNSHKDCFNCSLPATSQTGAMNMVIIDPQTGRLYLLQMILNFRGAITNFLTPFAQSVGGMLQHVKQFNETLDRSYAEVFSSCELKVPAPTALDRTNFFLDDSLRYTKVNLNHGVDDRDNIYMDVLTFPIGYSRFISLSSSIHVLNELHQHLCFDQVTEMCFVAALLNCHLRFHHAVQDLLDQAASSNFRFKDHPFYNRHLNGGNICLHQPFRIVAPS